MELGYAEKRPAKAVGVSKDPKNGQKKGKKWLILGNIKK